MFGKQLSFSLVLIAASLASCQSTSGNITANETYFSHENATVSTTVSTTMNKSTTNRTAATSSATFANSSIVSIMNASSTSTNSIFHASTSVTPSPSSPKIELTTNQMMHATLGISNTTSRTDIRSHSMSTSTETPKSIATTTSKTSNATHVDTVLPVLFNQTTSESSIKFTETTKTISTIRFTTKHLQNATLNETGRLAVNSETLATTVGGLTRSESLIGFAVVGCFALVIGGYLLVSCGARRYRRWQLNRLLISIRGDGHADDAEVDIDTQGNLQYGDEDSPDDAVFVRDPPSNRLRLDSSQRNRNQNSSRVGRYGGSLHQNVTSAALASSSLRSATATASFSRARTTLDRMGLRTPYDESDCDMLIAEHGGETDEANESVSLVATQPSRIATSTSNVVRTYDRAVDGDEPILVLDDTVNEVNALSRNESLI